MNELPTPWEGVEQPTDDQIAGSPWFNTETYKTFQSGLKALLEELMKFEAIANELEIDADPYKIQIIRLERMIDWGENQLEKAGSRSFVMDSGLSYGTLRYLKAGVLLLAKRLLEKEEEAIQKYENLPLSLLQEYEEKIKQLLNIAEVGMLNGLRPAQIFFEAPIIRKKERIVAKAQKNVEAKAYSIETSEIQIIDSVLRKRCLELLRKLVEPDFQEQLDIIVREMSVILEDRIRNVSGIKGKHGMALINAAFCVEPPLIKFSGEKDRQEMAQLLYRGYLGFVRNEVMHKLVPSYSKDRVMQLMGFVDYLLFLLSRAERTTCKKEE